ncbi:cytochrome P450 [Dentipellis sp. KUC8613]|nr:cytochrome P450 [Dentipellis sp. KUC8613]
MSLPFTPAKFQDFRHLIFVLIVGLCTALFVRYIRSPFRHLPPGPTGLPFLGNFFHLLERPQHLAFSRWANIYGDLFYLSVPGRRLLVINSREVAIDLLERRSTIYSNRPQSIVEDQFTGGLSIVSKPIDATWRRMRRAAHDALNKDVAPQYRPMQTTEAVLLATHILQTPQKWQAQIRRSAASLIMSMVYDHAPIASEEDKTIKDINEFVSRRTQALKPGTFWVEFFPWMMWIPERFAKWKREATYWFEHDNRMFEDLTHGVQTRLAAGKARSCFVSNLVDNAKSGLSYRENAWLAGVMYAAGSDTTALALTWLVVALAAYPHTQARAQAELDAVVGRARIPSFADFEHLPYLQALVKELLRWRSPSPFGLPHCTAQDDWYAGMFIPRGTVCLPNIARMNHDVDVYGANAGEFDPGRYLDEKGGLKEGPGAFEEDHRTFGFGRRACVGKHVANAALFIKAAVLLWAARVEPARDEDGKAVRVDPDAFVEDGLVLRPAHSDCEIKPRFAEVMDILSQERELL